MTPIVLLFSVAILTVAAQPVTVPGSNRPTRRLPDESSFGYRMPAGFDSGIKEPPPSMHAVSNQA